MSTAERPKNPGGRTNAVDERRAEFARYKEDVKKRGKPFHPYAMFHDTIMSLVVVAVIIALACIWYFTSGRGAGRLRDPRAALHGRRRSRRRSRSSHGRTGTSTSSSTCCGSSSGPSRSCSARSASRRSRIILLLAVPFIDRRRERRLSRRPIAVIAALARDRFDGRPDLEGRDRRRSSSRGDSEALVEDWIAGEQHPRRGWPRRASSSRTRAA